MRVAFGTTVLERGRAQGTVDGIGNYSHELLRRLRETPDLDVRPFAYSASHPAESNAELLNFGPFGPQALVSLATGLPFALASRQVGAAVDLVHAPDHLIPAVRRVPVVATLMDAIPLAHPEWVNYSFRGIKNALWKRSAHWADHVVTLSTHAKEELIRWFGLREERITVTPLGVDERWFREVPDATAVQTRSRHTLPERYFLFVGTLQPRKNLLRLIAAHRLLPASLRRECPLVVVGRAGWGCDEEVRLLSAGEAGTLRWLRYLPEDELVSVVASATALVFPSLHEGFGLPVLEAFAAGLPVIASNTTSLPEVAGDAALLVDPTQAGDIAEAMRLIASGGSLADELIRRGRARAREFTWEKTAAATAQAYRRVLSAG